MTWEDFLDDMRVYLKDTGTPKHSDAYIFLFFKDALRDYSQYFKVTNHRVQIAGTDGVFTLPNDFVEEVYVEAPKDTYLERRDPSAGLKFKHKKYIYHIVDGTLYTKDTISEIFITYLSLHPLPADETDLTFVLTFPEEDAEILMLYVKAKIMEGIRSKTSELDRFKPVGQRDDNPLVPETTILMQRYYQKIAQKIGGRAHFLHRRGRNR